MFPRHGHTFNHRMFLCPQRHDGFVEYDTLVFFSEHSHETFHEILSRILQVGSRNSLSLTHLDFLPYVIVPFKHAQHMLQRDDMAMARNQLLVWRTCEVRPSAHGNDSRARWGHLVLGISWTIHARRQDLLRSSIVWYPILSNAEPTKDCDLP